MNTKYIDLVEQTFDFPQEEFKISNNKLFWHGINLMELTATYGAPLKFTYLPKISENINKAKGWFQNSIKKHKYTGDYFYKKISFATTLPDSWLINKLFMMLLINKCNKKNDPVLFGGLTFDSVYYNSEQRINEIYLPVYEKNNPLQIPFLIQVHIKNLLLGLLVCSIV